MNKWEKNQTSRGVKNEWKVRQQAWITMFVTVHVKKKAEGEDIGGKALIFFFFFFLTITELEASSGWRITQERIKGETNIIAQCLEVVSADVSTSL